MYDKAIDTGRTCAMCAQAPPRFTSLERTVKQLETTDGGLMLAASKHGVTVDDARRAYDRVYALPRAAVGEEDEMENVIKPEIEPMSESSITTAAPAAKKLTCAERAAIYKEMRAQGMRPDAAAQEAGWSSYASAQSCCKKKNIAISMKAPNDVSATPVIAAKAALASASHENTKHTVTVKRASVLTQCWMGDDYIYEICHDGTIDMTPLGQYDVTVKLRGRFAVEALIAELQEMLDMRPDWT